MSDDRADRLRQTRNRAKQKATTTEATDDETDNNDAAVKAESPPNEQSDSTEQGNASSSVKKDQVGTYMYLPEQQHQELSRQFNLLKAEYEYEFGEFEKNRHFYPLVVQYGLDHLAGLDASEIKTLLEQLDETD